MRAIRASERKYKTREMESLSEYSTRSAMAWMPSTMYSPTSKMPVPRFCLCWRCNKSRCIAVPWCGRSACRVLGQCSFWHRPSIPCTPVRPSACRSGFQRRSVSILLVDRQRNGLDARRVKVSGGLAFARGRGRTNTRARVRVSSAVARRREGNIPTIREPRRHRSR